MGTGSFGRVHLAQSHHNHRYYAIKVLKKSEVVRLKQVEHTNSEKNILEIAANPFMVNLWGTFQDDLNLYMVMDYVPGGELFSILRKNQVRALVYRKREGECVYSVGRTGTNVGFTTSAFLIMLQNFMLPKCFWPLNIFIQNKLFIEI